MLATLSVNEEIKIRRNVEAVACGNLMFCFFLSVLLFEVFNVLVALKMKTFL